MKWVSCSYHNLQHIASEKPRELPTATSVCETNHTYQAVVSSLWPLAAVAGAETHYICIEQSFYEYEVCGVSQTYLNTCYKWKPRELPTATSVCETRHRRGWGCIPMTTGRSSRCWNALYMYRVIDLQWVWSGWGVSNISQHMLQVKNQENCLLPLWLWDQAYIRLGLHPYDHWQQQQVLKHIIYVQGRCAMNMKWVGCLKHILTHDTR
jgi:hypothetical protein